VGVRQSILLLVVAIAVSAVANCLRRGLDCGQALRQAAHRLTLLPRSYAYEAKGDRRDEASLTMLSSKVNEVTCSTQAGSTQVVQQLSSLPGSATCALSSKKTGRPGQPGELFSLINCSSAKGGAPCSENVDTGSKSRSRTSFSSSLDGKQSKRTKGDAGSRVLSRGSEAKKRTDLRTIQKTIQFSAMWPSHRRSQQAAGENPGGWDRWAGPWSCSE